MGNSVSVIEYKDLLNDLSTKDINNRDRENMQKFWAYSEDSSDQSMVYTAITSEDIKSLKQNRPMNLLYIIREIIDIFYTNATSYETIEEAQVVSVTKGAINLLIKFLPYILDNKAYMDKILWEGEDTPYGVRLWEGILTMLFKPGFTIRPLPKDVSEINKRGIDQNALWKNGVSTSGDVYNHYYTNYDANRISLLRLLLVCISQPLYHGSEEYLTILNPFSWYLTCRRSSNIKSLFVSLLNNIISYDIEGYKIPYLSSLNTQGDIEKLLEIGLHVLLVLIEYKPPTEENLKYLIDGGYISLKRINDYFLSTETKEKKEEKTLSEDLTTNEFHRLLQVIHGKMNLEPFVESMTKYFSNLVNSQQTYLPNSVTQVPFFQELYILFWRFLQGNPYFLDEVISHPDFLQKIYLTVLHHFDSLKKDPTKCNLLYIWVFILLTFSSNRDFSMLLNEPFGLHISFDLKDFESGTYADLTYQIIHRMIKVGPGILRPLYKSLVSVISNTSPYVKSLTKDSCECIFMLIKTFSNADLLKKREETSRILSNLFEAVNYILLYHDQGNEEFLVALIKYREILKINDLRLALGSETKIEEAVDQVNTDQKVTEEVKEETNTVTKEPEAQNNDKVEQQESKDDKETTVDDKKDETEVKAEDVKEEVTEQIKEEKVIDGEGSVKQEQNTNKTQEEAKEEPNVVNQEDHKDDKVADEKTNDESNNEDKEESKEDQNEENMVDVPLDDIKHKENDALPAGTHEQHQFLSPEWEAEWKKNLNFPNLKHAIQFTDDKARAFLSKNPSPDNNIDADKVTFIQLIYIVCWILKKELTQRITSKPSENSCHNL